MPLLLCDLDDTLVDRTATFHRWLDRHLRRADHARWDRINTYLHLERLVSRLAAQHERSQPRSYRLEDGVVEALTRAREAGWTLAVITNGGRRSQPAKIRSAGIADLVDAICISSHDGFAKPDPRVFRTAAARAGTTLEGAWVIGDDLDQEIAGARESGLRSVWLTRHHPDPASVADVDLTATTFPEAVDLVLEATGLSRG